jgi:hypothetical protein
MGGSTGIVLAVTLCACYQPTPAAGAPCAENGQCPGDQLCDRSQSPPVCVTSLPIFDAPLQSPDARDAAGDASDARIPDAHVPGAMLVQQEINTATSGTTLSLTLTTAPENGDVLVMIGAGIKGSLAGVSGGGVPIWQKATGSFVNCNIEIWYGVTDGSSATVTIALTNNMGIIWMNVSEWSGLAITAMLDGASSDGRLVSPAAPGPITTTNANDLLLFGVTDTLPNTFGTPGPGSWTAMTSLEVAQCRQVAWYSVVSATGTYAPTVTETANAWEAAVVALKIAP